MRARLQSLINPLFKDPRGEWNVEAAWVNEYTKKRSKLVIVKGHKKVTYFYVPRIDLVVFLEAILMSRELLEKLQCLYENLMSNNFRKNGCSEKNNYELYTKATQQWILPTNFGGNNCA